MGMFTEVVGQVEARLAAVVHGSVERFVDTLQMFEPIGLIDLLMMAAVTIMGYRLMLGFVKDAAQAWQFFGVLAIVAVFIHSDGLMLEVFYYGIPGIGKVIGDGIAGITVGGASSGQVGVGALVDDTVWTGLGVSRRLWEAGGLFDITTLLAVFVMILTLIVGAYAAFLIVFSKVYLAVLGILSPVFFCLALFPRVQSIFWRWFNLLLQASFIPVFTYAILGLAMGLVRDLGASATIDIEALAGGESMAAFIFASIVLLVLLWQVQTVVATLTTGAMTSSMGIFTQMAVVGSAGAYLTAKGVGAAGRLGAGAINRFRRGGDGQRGGKGEKGDSGSPSRSPEVAAASSRMGAEESGDKQAGASGDVAGASDRLGRDDK